MAELIDLGCGLGWAEGSTSSIVFTSWCQCALMGGHIGVTWRIRLNHPSATAMWYYVKFLWPLAYLVLLYISFDWWMCAFCVNFFSYQAKRLAWGTSAKWPVLCRVGRKTLTSIRSVCLFCAVLSATIVHSAVHRHINRPEFVCWLDLAFLCITLYMLDLAFWDYYVL